jgi:hypothetical protein
MIAGISLLFLQINRVNFVARLSTAEKITEAISVIFFEPTRNT